MNIIKNENVLCITLDNAKLGGVIPSVSLPRGLSCRLDAPCFRGCYGAKIESRPNVYKAYKNNYDFYKNDSRGFFEAITEFLNNSDVSYKFFRWFGVGDIVDYNFLLGIIETANKCKDTKFLMFTKKFDLVNMFLDFNEKPENLTIIFSGWNEAFKVENPHNLPCSYVFTPKQSNTHIPEFAIPCEGSCKTCKSCWTLKKGQSVYFKKH